MVDIKIRADILLIALMLSRPHGARKTHACNAQNFRAYFMLNYLILFLSCYGPGTHIPWEMLNEVYADFKNCSIFPEYSTKKKAS